MLEFNSLAQKPRHSMLTLMQDCKKQLKAILTTTDFHPKTLISRDDDYKSCLHDCDAGIVSATKMAGIDYAGCTVL